jgi:uncharacterized RDD family membrane protein YckC
MTDVFSTADSLPPTPGLLRRLAAIFYDLLLLFALLAVATTLFTLPFGMPEGWAFLAFQWLLFEIIPLLFFTGFWWRGGQTLGMRSWRLRVVRMDGSPLSWSDALKRHLAALLSCLTLGLGFIWVVIDAEGLAWHDRLSGTRLIRIDNLDQ